MKLGIITSSNYNRLPPGETNALDEIPGIEHRLLIWDRVSVQELRGYDALLVRTCWDYHLKYNEFRQWLAEVEESGLSLINPTQTILWNANKQYLFDLMKLKLPVVPTYPGDTSRALTNDHPACEKVIIKKLVSASAHELRLVPADRISETGFNTAEVILQPYLKEIETNGEWSLIYFRHEYSHAVLKVPKGGEHRVQKDFGGSVAFRQPPNSVVTIANQVIDAITHPFHYARVDLVETSQGCLVMEVELIEPDLFIDSAVAKRNYQQFVLHLA